MLNVQIGMFPGRIESYVIEEGTTVAAALELAGLEVGAEQEIKVDGAVVGLGDIVPSTARLLILTKRLKGAK